MFTYVCNLVANERKRRIDKRVRLFFSSRTNLLLPPPLPPPPPVGSRAAFSCVSSRSPVHEFPRHCLRLNRINVRGVQQALRIIHNVLEIVHQAVQTVYWSATLFRTGQKVHRPEFFSERDVPPALAPVPPLARTIENPSLPPLPASSTTARGRFFGNEHRSFYK